MSIYLILYFLYNLLNYCFGDLILIYLKKIIIVFLLTLMGLFACFEKETLRPSKALPSLVFQKELFIEDSNISISIKPLTGEESEKYLKSNVLKL